MMIIERKCLLYYNPVPVCLEAFGFNASPVRGCVVAEEEEHFG
jgi:hypothetical protein